MRIHQLKEASNYISHILIERRNSFGDQVLQIEHETSDGMKKYIWTELNHKGNYRKVTIQFLDYMKAHIEAGLL